MKEVSEFEARLLRILRCLMHRASMDQTLALLVGRIDRPRCLSRNCVELIQDGLSKGVTEWLARSGWLDSRFMRNDEVSGGRLWQRHLPTSMALTFSSSSMELLIWLTAENFAEPAVPLKLDAATLTVGDRILMLMTFSALRNTAGVNVLVRQPGFSTNGLISMVFPDHAGLIPEFTEPNIGVWCQPETSWVTEALQSRLARQWFLVEDAKRISSNYEDVQQIGQHQSLVLNEFFVETERAGRKDLCLFVLSAACRLFQSVAVDRWYERMDFRGLRLSERSEILRAALAFFFGLQRLQTWTQQAQRVSFYDDDYRASQLWKSEWERLQGDAILQRAERIIAMVDPLRTTTASH